MSSTPFYGDLLSTVSNVFDAYSSVLFLKNIGPIYSLVSYFSLGDNINLHSKVNHGQGIVGWIIKNRKPLVINDFSRENRTLCYYLKGEEQRIKSFMGVPLQKGRGVLCVDSKKTYTFTEKDLKILYNFAKLVDSFLDEYSKVQETEYVVDYYNAFQTICSLKDKFPKWDEYLLQLLNILSTYTGFFYCLFVSRNERGTGYYLERCNKKIEGMEGLEGKRFHINDGVIGWVFKNHKSIILSQERDRCVSSLFGKNYMGKEFHTIVCLPLIVNLKTRGVFVFLDKRKKNISKGLSDFFCLLSNHMSLFLENLYLKDKLRKKKREVKN